MCSSDLAPAAPAAGGAGNERAFGRVDFPPNAEQLPDSARRLLDSAADALNRDVNAKLQLVAYAAGTEENDSAARRLSLSRALAVRRYLIEKGILTGRMDVRALGNRIPDGPPDRVDIVLVQR